MIEATDEVYTDYEKYLTRYAFPIWDSLKEMLILGQARFLHTGRSSSRSLDSLADLLMSL